MIPAPSTASIRHADLERLLSRERLGSYVGHAGSLDRAIDLYRWNAEAGGALWPSIGHVEVALRNAMSAGLTARHDRLERSGSWLDDPAAELDPRMRSHIAAARRRVRKRGKAAVDCQTISELGFGFWRFLITRRHTALWPDLASAFPGAPDRRVSGRAGPAPRDGRGSGCAAARAAQPHRAPPAHLEPRSRGALRRRAARRRLSRRGSAGVGRALVHRAGTAARAAGRSDPALTFSSARREAARGRLHSRRPTRRGASASRCPTRECRRSGGQRA